MVCLCQSGQYTIEDLFDLVFPPDMGVRGYLCMIYNCFLDDSKDQNQSQMIVSAGFYGTRDDWGELRARWSKRLSDDGLEYFKTSEFKMLEGQFAKFKTSEYPPPTGRDKARSIRSGLQAIMKQIPGIRGIGVCIPMEDLEKCYSRPEFEVFRSDPYQRALEGVMHETIGRIKAKPGRNMVAFVHDDGPDFDQLRRYYNDFKAVNPKSAGYMAGFQPLDDKKHPPLQAADMVANFTLGIGLEWLESGRKVEKLKEMESSIGKLGVWDEQYTLDLLKRNLQRLGNSR